MSVERMRPGDEKRLAAAALAQYDCAASADWLAALLNDPAVLCVAAYETESPVGLAYGYMLPRIKRDELEFLLYEIDVSEKHRRRGHGQAMVSALLDWACENGADESWVLTDDGNPPALATYASAGGNRHLVDQVMFTFQRD